MSRTCIINNSVCVPHGLIVLLELRRHTLSLIFTATPWWVGDNKVSTWNEGFTYEIFWCAEARSMQSSSEPSPRKFFSKLHSEAELEGNEWLTRATGLDQERGCYAISYERPDRTVATRRWIESSLRRASWVVFCTQTNNAHIMPRYTCTVVHRFIYGPDKPDEYTN